MQRPVHAIGITLVLGAALTIAGSCSNSTGTGALTAADVQGSYTLISLTFPPNPALTPPAQMGTLTLTLTRYTVVLTGVVTQTDSGTYTINGNAWTQTSDVLPVQSVGVASLSNGVLTDSVSTAGNISISTWQKQ